MKKLSTYIREASKPDMNKEFKNGIVCITRQDFLDMPCPMAADLLSDKDMQAIVDDAFEALIAYQPFYGEDGTDYSAYDVYSGAVADNWIQLEELDAEVCEFANNHFWHEIELAARAHGMQYYEDMK